MIVSVYSNSINGMLNNNYNAAVLGLPWHSWYIHQWALAMFTIQSCGKWMLKQCMCAQLMLEIRSKNINCQNSSIIRHLIMTCQCLQTEAVLWLSAVCTWRQSSEAITILGHFERHANSNGRKYLSASTWLDFARGTGNAAELPPSTAPLRNTSIHKHVAPADVLHGILSCQNAQWRQQKTLSVVSTRHNVKQWLCFMALKWDNLSQCQIHQRQPSHNDTISLLSL